MATGLPLLVQTTMTSYRLFWSPWQPKSLCESVNQSVNQSGRLYVETKQ